MEGGEVAKYYFYTTFRTFSTVLDPTCAEQ